MLTEATDQPSAARNLLPGEAPSRSPTGRLLSATWRLLTWLPERLFHYFFRMAPLPCRPRLLVLGRPGPDAPVLVTANYGLTVRRLSRALRDSDCYVLVAPAGGIDVWCAAGGSRLTVDSVISILKTSRIGERVAHRRLLLPQLAAPGIDLYDLRRRTGWTGAFGPLWAKDIPKVLRTRRVTKPMRSVTFSPHERLEMALALWTSVSFRYTIFPCLIFGLAAAVWFPVAVAGVACLAFLGCFVLPGQTFVQKVGLLGLVVLSGVLLVLFFTGELTLANGLLATVVLGLASFAVGTAFPSYTPFWACGYSSFFYGSCHQHLRLEEAECIGCGLCEAVCPVDCFETTAGGEKRVFARPEACLSCGACTRQCPTGAIAPATGQAAACSAG